MEVDKGKSKRILRDIKKIRQEEAIIDVDVETEKFVIYSLAGDLFAFKGHYVKEILIPTEISYVPGSPDFLLGVINVRGDIESVAALEKILGLPTTKTSDKNRILLTEDREIRSGILVESIEDVIDVPVDAINPPLATMTGPMADFLQGEMEYRGKNVMVLDVPKLFKRFIEI
ncbi:MAG: chemotaxis protein CheW [Proteobacteria bacterium]|nr:chemotaxis protein CheW [Pseudomonadota bacterium]MBU1715473.1 chemotaxis protein CheW [Pseudomonadota bacterium]